MASHTTNRIHVMTDSEHMSSKHAIAENTGSHGLSGTINGRLSSG